MLALSPLSGLSGRSDLDCPSRDGELVFDWDGVLVADKDGDGRRGVRSGVFGVASRSKLLMSCANSLVAALRIDIVPDRKS